MSAVGFSQLLLLTLGCLVGVLGIVVALKRPWWSVVATVASIPLVPVWVGFAVGPFFVTAHLALALVTIASVIASRRQMLRVHVADLVLLGVVLLSAAIFVLGLSSLNQAYEFFQWLVAYTFARVASEVYGLRRLFSLAAVCFTIAAVAVVLEWMTGLNVWTTYVVVPNGLYAAWGTLQPRGGIVRTEGAFGHSIAAGLCLAAAAILALDSRLRPAIRLLLVAVLAIATLTTFSRAGMVSFAIGIVLAIVLSRTTLPRWARIGTLGVLSLGGAIFLILSTQVFADSGSEAEDSASYRLWLLELLPSIQPLGLAAGFSRSSEGEASFGSFRSIDNALLLLALRTGWVPVVVLLGLLVGLGVAVLHRRVGVASAAVVALSPALVSVAFITQYATVFWMTVGLAVTELVASNAERSEAPLREQLVPASRLGQPARSE